MTKIADIVWFKEYTNGVCYTSKDSLRFKMFLYPTEGLPEIPDELYARLDTAHFRYLAFIGASEGVFSFEEIEADRERFAHLVLPPLENGVIQFALFNCVEYMHLCYGVSKDLAAVFCYQDTINYATSLLYWEEPGDYDLEEGIEAAYRETKSLVDSLCRVQEESVELAN